jgi:hypothetical protein
MNNIMENKKDSVGAPVFVETDFLFELTKIEKQRDDLCEKYMNINHKYTYDDIIADERGFIKINKIGYTISHFGEPTVPNIYYEGFCCDEDGNIFDAIYNRRSIFEESIINQII